MSGRYATPLLVAHNSPLPTRPTPARLVPFPNVIHRRETSTRNGRGPWLLIGLCELLALLLMSRR